MNTISYLILSLRNKYKIVSTPNGNQLLPLLAEHTHHTLLTYVVPSLWASHVRLVLSARSTVRGNGCCG